MSSSHVIRQQFIDFFAQRHGHGFVASSPVVPHDDPTLLFANAGMNQFKPYFLGTQKPEHTRVANTQKCIRAGGKHNDLEDVGHDTYHHTFFEMLGNWSFGDYFKKEAIDWAWELLTQVWKIDPERLHATYFEGDASEGLEPDDEARELWMRYLPVQRVHPGNKKDNFWEMGDTGPCGPCSEIHYDGTSDLSGGNRVNASDPNVIEIWNLVFIQFNRGTDGKLAQLPARHVDTGMGFERIVRVLQGKTSNYDTDVFTPIFTAIGEATGAAAYNGGADTLENPVDIAYRVIADHIRTLTFALTDGAHCGNEGRDYVLRRILRRAVRYGRQSLGCRELFLHRLVEPLVEHMGGAFAELKRNWQAVADEIRQEEESFIRTLDRGIALFEEAANRSADVKAHTLTQEENAQLAQAAGEPAGGTHVFRPGIANWGALPAEQRPQISAADAFQLYDTYGFPLDLTQLMAQERGMRVDVEGFNRLMDEARQRSRAVGGSADQRAHLVELVQKHAPTATTFTGYDGPSWEGRATLALFTHAGESGYGPADTAPEGEQVAAVLSSSPFYAEAGGQVGDRGTITTELGELSVEDTLKIGDTTFHLGRVTRGQLQAGETSLTAQVDADRLDRIRANHTATHMMNRALRRCVSATADQRGSLVDDEKLRFDFTCEKAVNPQAIEEVEKIVNADIAADQPVCWEIAPQQDALKIKGLRAVFGEKYPPRVRMVCIGENPQKLLSDPDNDRWADLSIEFCGGVHLARTSEAQAFCIVSEEAVGKGVRRITALTGERAAQARSLAEQLHKRLAGLSDAPSEALLEQLPQVQGELESATLPLVERGRLRATLSELTARLKEYDKAQGRKLEETVIEHARAIAEQQEGPIIVAEVPDADAATLRTAMDVIRKRHEEAAVLLGCVADDKVALVASVPKALIAKGLKAGDWIRETARIVGGGGGGRPDMAQAGGREPEKLPEALDKARAFAQAAL